MKTRIVFLVFLMCLSAFLMTGCSGSVQIHERMMVQGIGIDITDSGYKVTIQALDFKNPAGENEPSVKVMELGGRTLFEALDNASKRSGLVPMYSQNLIVVVGHDAAVGGVNHFLDFFIRHYEARPNVKICVSETTASEIMAFESDEGVMQAKDISELIPNEINSDILHFAAALQESTSDPRCAYLGIDGDDKNKSINIKGLAFFAGDKFAGAVLEDEYLAVLAVMGMGDLGVYSIYADGIGSISLKLGKVKSHIKPNVGEIDKTFEVDIDVKASVLEVTPNKGVRIGNEEQTKIQKQLDGEIQRICKQTVEKIIKSNSDIFRFGKVLMNKNPQYFKKVSGSWKEIMQTFSYKINVKSELTITGTEI